MSVQILGYSDGEAAALKRAEDLSDEELLVAARIIQDLASNWTPISPYNAGYGTRLLIEARRRKVLEA